MTKKILVIGEICKDVFIYGKTTRICPEAPAPVFVPSRTETSRGMAGNVIQMFENLGYTVDTITQEDFGLDIDEFPNFVDDTITKTRYIDEAHDHLHLRIDKGDYEPKRHALNVDDIQDILSNLDKYAAVVISDYGKGLVTKKIIQVISMHHNNVYLDTKKQLGDWSRSCKFIKLNEKEFGALKDKYHDNLIITLGSAGCKYKQKLYPVERTINKNLSGAGDTFLVGLVHGILLGHNSQDSIVIANACASLAVTKPGVYPITKKDFAQIYQKVYTQLKLQEI